MNTNRYGKVLVLDKSVRTLLIFSIFGVLFGASQASGLELFCGVGQSSFGGEGKSGFVAGIGQDWVIDDRGLAFELEGEYIEKGGQGTISYHNPNNGEISEEDGDVSLKYIQISLFLKKMKKTGDIKPQIYCGGGVGFLVDEDVNFSNSQLVSNEFRKMDAHLSFGVATVFSDKFLIDIRYTKGLRTISDEETDPYSQAKSSIFDSPIDESKNSTWQAVFGFYF